MQRERQEEERVKEDTRDGGSWYRKLRGPARKAGHKVVASLPYSNKSLEEGDSHLQTSFYHSEFSSVTFVVVPFLLVRSYFKGKILPEKIFFGR